jgi:hypothetical protein
MLENTIEIPVSTEINQKIYPEFSINELNQIRDKIETMPKFNQIEILRILSKRNDVTLNENKYGIHINLTDVDKSIIYEIKVYIDYINAQEINLCEIEHQKEQFINTYFSKDNKDNDSLYSNSKQDATSS